MSVIFTNCLEKKFYFQYFLSLYISTEFLVCQQLLSSSLSSSSSSTTDNSIIIVVAFIIILIIIAVTAAYVTYYVKRSRKMKGNYKPSEAEFENNANDFTMEKFKSRSKIDDYDERLIWIWRNYVKNSYHHSLSVTPGTIICPSLLGSLIGSLCLSVLLLKPISR